MGQKGKLSGDIGGLIKLIYLDMSFNQGLTGSLSPRIEDLQKLTYKSLLVVASVAVYRGNWENLLSFLKPRNNAFSGTLNRKPRNNAFNGTLNTGGISGRLIENLVCDKALRNRNYCQHQQ